MTNVIKVHFDAKIAEDALNDLLDMVDEGKDNFDWDKAKEKFSKLEPYVKRVCEIDE